MKELFEGLLDTISKFSHGQVAIAASLAIFFYFLMPILKVWASSRLRISGRKEETQVEADHDVRQWLLKRTETLEKEREHTMQRINQDNESLRSRILAMEQDMRIVRDQNDLLWRRISSLEWIFLTEICLDLNERITKAKRGIACKVLDIDEIGNEAQISEVSGKIEKEFFKVIEELKTSFLMKQLEQASKEEFNVQPPDQPMVQLALDHNTDSSTKNE